jgi:hypothetical protein
MTAAVRICECISGEVTVLWGMEASADKQNHACRGQKREARWTRVEVSQWQIAGKIRKVERPVT